jgi:hypothetical protein
LQKGLNTAESSALVLHPESFTPDDGVFGKKIQLASQTIYIKEFEGQISLSGNGVGITYKTQSLTYDWYIPDERPSWMQKANMSVVRSKPKLVIYDKNGEISTNAIKQWRGKGEQIWHDWKEQMPKGLIELRMELNGVKEEDRFFNIGHLQIEVKDSSLLNAEVYITNNDFRFQLNESELVSVSLITNNHFLLTCLDSNKQPKAIKASLRRNGQDKGVLFELTPPFSGIEIIDNTGCLVKHRPMLQGDLYGYRILSDGNPLLVKFYNTNRRDITLIDHVIDGPKPLIYFGDKIDQLFSLCDPLDGDVKVQIDICRDGQNQSTLLKSYSIERYAQSLECTFDDQGSPLVKLVNLIPSNENIKQVYAVPLECESQSIFLKELERMDEGFRFVDEPLAFKYIVFGDGVKGGSIKPAFFQIAYPQNIEMPDDRKTRLEIYGKSLLDGDPESDSWKQVLSYYQICIANDLPFATFEIIRACTLSSCLAARLFLFLVCYSSSEYFATAECPKLEEDLGFCFHWVAASDWNEAITWLECDTRVFSLVSQEIANVYSTQHPVEHFQQIRQFVLQDSKPTIDANIALNQKFNSVRATLGEKVLRGIPNQYPKLPEIYNQILAPIKAGSNVTLLLKCPMAVALSIAGKDLCLWDDDHIRRNVRYSQQLHPDWYGFAVCYFLSKI